MGNKGSLNIVLLGAPGAGKGTQADILVKAYHLPHVSTGDMLRAAVKEGGKLGIKIKTCMDKGELVPDEIVTASVVDRMKKSDAANGVILDGYPRTLAQAESLDKALSREKRNISAVLYFKTSENVVVQRLSGRRVCPSCGKNYHVTNIPPKKEGICDTCNIKLVLRDDDKPETVKNRLKVYEERTKDLVDYYKKNGLLREVDGDLSANKLFEQINTLFKREGFVNDCCNG
ncbi:MAG: adenylate kinase [Candidatus Omnitrophica bacterium]|nr:adenylate kinase [Candidatus Omnitrophota bacterium]